MKARVMHYLNQFFAGIGGEDKADVPVGPLKGVVGPGKLLQELLKDEAEIVVTAYCGDNYLNAHRDEALASILKIAKDNDVKMVVAGPAFTAGRYGSACIEVCHSMSTSLGLYCVTGMHPDNPAVSIYKDYKDWKVFCLPTAEDVKGMDDALSRMAKFALKLAAGSAIGPAAEEGYIPRGIRLVEPVSEIGAKRAINMLLDKYAGRPFTTEIPLVFFEAVPVPPPIENLKDACIALISSVGVIPPGNPDGIIATKNDKWGKHSTANMNSMKDAKWEVIHSGYNNEFMRRNPNFGVPLDACRELEREGVFGQLYPYYYTSSGSLGEVAGFQAIGRAIARDLMAEGVDAAILVSAWGTCTRSGAVLDREIEKQGIPVAFITAMTSIGKQVGANRVITGTNIPYPCGDPNMPEEQDLALRLEIIKCALKALQTKVEGPTVFVPDVKYTFG